MSMNLQGDTTKNESVVVKTCVDGLRGDLQHSRLNC